MRGARGVQAGLAVACSLLLPTVSGACAVCFAAANDKSRKAFFDMTIFMSLLPLLVLAAGVAWLAFNARAFLSSEFEEREDAHVPASGERAKQS